MATTYTYNPADDLALRNAAKGMTGQQITDFATNAKMSSADVARVLGTTEQAVQSTGYGSSGGLINVYKDMKYTGPATTTSSGGGLITQPKTYQSTGDKFAEPETMSGKTPDYKPPAAPAPVALGEAPKTTVSTVDYKPETMSSWQQLGKMLSSGNETMQSAQTAGMQIGNARGLINSSMGQTAVLDSMTRAAQPYALQDSAAQLQNAQFNAGQTNTVGVANTNILADFKKTASALGLEYDKLGQQDRQFVDQMSQQDRQFVKTLKLETDKFGENKVQFAAQLAENVRQFNASETLKKYGIDVDAATRAAATSGQIAASAASDASRYSLAKMEAELRTQENKDTKSAALYQQTIASIASIWAGNGSAEAKREGTDNHLQLLRTGMDLYGKDSSVIPETFGAKTSKTTDSTAQTTSTQTVSDPG